MSSRNCFWLFFYLSLLHFGFSRKIYNVDDSELVDLIRNEDLVVLFTKEHCQKCDELEDILENIQTDLKDALGCGVVKATNSQMVSIYDSSREPSLIYFRRGIPLLYDGDYNGDEIIQLFSDNQEPVVKELTDATFEHLTQASTGATTGDWLVFFYSLDCVSCRRIFAVWEGVGAVLRRRLNVARINRLEGGILTAKRFNIDESPVFLFIRQGKVYRYKGKELNVKSFVSFVNNLHSYPTKPDSVPPPLPVGGLQNLAQSFIKTLVDNKNYQIFAGTVTGIVLIIFFAAKCCRSTKTKQKSTNKSTTDKKKQK